MENSEFSSCLRQLGYKSSTRRRFWFRHQINRVHLHKSIFRDRYFRWGRSEAYLTDIPGALWRFGFYVAKELVVGNVLSIGYVLAGKRDTAFRYRCEALYRAGFFYQHWRLSKCRDSILKKTNWGWRIPAIHNSIVPDTL